MVKKLEYFYMTPEQEKEVTFLCERLAVATKNRWPGWKKGLLYDASDLMNIVNSCIHDEPEKITVHERITS